MSTIQHPHRYQIGLQSERATAANAALFAGLDALEAAADVRADVKRVFGTRKGNLHAMTANTTEAERVARRAMNVARDAAERMFGLVSVSACGLWGITRDDRVFVVDSTSHGSDYLRAVRLTDGTVVDDLPVEDVVAFFDTIADVATFQAGGRVSL